MNLKKHAWVILLAVVIIIVMVLSLTNAIEQTLGMCIAIGLVIVFNGIIAFLAIRNDVKIIGYLMILFAVVGVVLLGFNIAGYIKTNQMTNYKFQITVVPEKSEKKFLFTYDNHDYYTLNVKDVKAILKSDKKTYDLKDALEGNHITLDEILGLAIPNEDTAGYKIYYDGGQKNYENDEYSIVVCDNAKKDVIFSTFDYKYEEGLCE